MLKTSSKRLTADGQPHINPEELICELFAKVLANKVELKVIQCDESLIHESGAHEGQYPILIYKHWFISRKYIWQFWCHLSDIDNKIAKLNEDEKEKTHHLS